MAKSKRTHVRTVKHIHAIHDMGNFWLVLEQLTARFKDQRLDEEYRFKQKYLPADDLKSCYDAWNMLLRLTQAAIEGRDAAMMRECFDCVECCEMTRNPKLILEPAYVVFWEHLKIEGARQEQLGIVRLMPKLCREAYLNDHSELRE